MRHLTLWSLVFVACAAPLWAIPRMISYQGYLTAAGGSPLDTTVAMTFRLFPDSAMGWPLWTELHSGVAVNDGSFNVQLGRYTNLADSILDQPQIWLGIQVGTDSGMAPRVRLTSVAYSFRTGSIDSAAGGVVIGDVVINGRLNAGSGNSNTGTHAHVLGQNNTASGLHSTVAGGASNEASNVGAAVGGGDANEASGANATVGGGDSNTSSGGWAVIAGGYENSATQLYASISGGQGNTVSGEGAAIGGGQWNVSGAMNSVVSGGASNRATGSYATVGGGLNNRARGDYSVVAGGGATYLPDSNYAGATGATVAGGIGNQAVDEHASVGGGLRNHAYDLGSTVSGGLRNWAGNVATVAGGDSNYASGILSFVGGGDFNVASGDRATVAGGTQNQATNVNAAIGGGSQNLSSGLSATVGGGLNNVSSGSMSAISGGRYNRARGTYSAVVGGGGASLADSNSARGEASTVLGGRRNEATGIFSLAAGYRAKAIHPGSFVWADSTGADFSSVIADQFSVRASGGIYLWTNAAANVGVTLTSGDNTWNSVCDSTLKTRMGQVDGAELLARVEQLPVYRWYHRNGDPGIQHIGPMAQDFWNLFQVGADSLKISTLDPAGIALAAIQELSARNRGLESQLAAQQSELRLLRARLDQLAPVQIGAMTR